MTDPVPTLPDVVACVINVGLEAFADALAAAGVRVVHVDWRPPGGGDPRLVALLLALEDDEDEPDPGRP
jgi:hypothetical protein